MNNNQNGDGDEGDQEEKVTYTLNSGLSVKYPADRAPTPDIVLQRANTPSPPPVTRSLSPAPSTSSSRRGRSRSPRSPEYRPRSPRGRRTPKSPEGWSPWDRLIKKKKEPDRSRPRSRSRSPRNRSRSPRGRSRRRSSSPRTPTEGSRTRSPSPQRPPSPPKTPPPERVNSPPRSPSPERSPAPRPPSPGRILRPIPRSPPRRPSTPWGVPTTRSGSPVRRTAPHHQNYADENQQVETRNGNFNHQGQRQNQHPYQRPLGQRNGDGGYSGGGRRHYFLNQRPRSYSRPFNHYFRRQQQPNNFTMQPRSQVSAGAVWQSPAPQHYQGGGYRPPSYAGYQRTQSQPQNLTVNQMNRNNNNNPRWNYNSQEMKREEDENTFAQPNPKRFAPPRHHTPPPPPPFESGPVPAPTPADVNNYVNGNLNNSNGVLNNNDGILNNSNGVLNNNNGILNNNPIWNPLDPRLNRRSQGPPPPPLPPPPPPLLYCGQNNLIGQPGSGQQNQVVPTINQNYPPPQLTTPTSNWPADPRLAPPPHPNIDSSPLNLLADAVVTVAQVPEKINTAEPNNNNNNDNNITDGPPQPVPAPTDVTLVTGVPRTEPVAGSSIWRPAAGVFRSESVIKHSRMEMAPAPVPFRTVPDSEPKKVLSIGYSGGGLSPWEPPPERPKTPGSDPCRTVPVAGVARASEPIAGPSGASEPVPGPSTASEPVPGPSWASEPVAGSSRGSSVSADSLDAGTIAAIYTSLDSRTKDSITRKLSKIYHEINQLEDPTIGDLGNLGEFVNFFEGVSAEDLASCVVRYPEQMGKPFFTLLENQQRQDFTASQFQTQNNRGGQYSGGYCFDVSKASGGNGSARTGERPQSNPIDRNQNPELARILNPNQNVHQLPILRDPEVVAEMISKAKRVEVLPMRSTAPLLYAETVYGNSSTADSNASTAGFKPINEDNNNNNNGKNPEEINLEDEETDTELEKLMEPECDKRKKKTARRHCSGNESGSRSGSCSHSSRQGTDSASNPSLCSNSDCSCWEDSDDETASETDHSTDVGMEELLSDVADFRSVTPPGVRKRIKVKRRSHKKRSVTPKPTKEMLAQEESESFRAEMKTPVMAKTPVMGKTPLMGTKYEKLFLSHLFEEPPESAIPLSSYRPKPTTPSSTPTPQPDSGKLTPPPRRPEYDPKEYAGVKISAILDPRIRTKETIRREFEGLCRQAGRNPKTGRRLAKRFPKQTPEQSQAVEYIMPATPVRDERELEPSGGNQTDPNWNKGNESPPRDIYERERSGSRSRPRSPRSRSRPRSPRSRSRPRSPRSRSRPRSPRSRSGARRSRSGGRRSRSGARRSTSGARSSSSRSRGSRSRSRRSRSGARSSRSRSRRLRSKSPMSRSGSRPRSRGRSKTRGRSRSRTRSRTRSKSPPIPLHMLLRGRDRLPRINLISTGPPDYNVEEERRRLPKEISFEKVEEMHSGSIETMGLKWVVDGVLQEEKDLEKEEKRLLKKPPDPFGWSFPPLSFEDARDRRREIEYRRSVYLAACRVTGSHMMVMRLMGEEAIKINQYDNYQTYMSTTDLLEIVYNMIRRNPELYNHWEFPIPEIVRPKRSAPP